MSAIPTPILIDCDPGHDDAIALLLALASPEVQLLGVTSVAGNQTLDKTTANAIRVLEFAGHPDVEVAAGADRPLIRAQYAAADVHGETGLDGPDLPPPGKAPVPQHAADFLAEKIRSSEQPVTLVAVGPLTNVALLLALHPGRAAGADRPDGRRNRRRQRHSRRRVQHLVRPRGGRARLRERHRHHHGRPRRHAQSAVHAGAHRPARGPRGGDGHRAAPFLQQLPSQGVRLRRLADSRCARRRARARTTISSRRSSATSRSRPSPSSAVGERWWISGNGRNARRTRTSAWRSTRKVFSSCWSSGSTRSNEPRLRRDRAARNAARSARARRRDDS